MGLSLPGTFLELKQCVKVPRDVKVRSQQEQKSIRHWYCL